MRTLTRNQKTAYYQLYLGQTDVLDDNGNITEDKTESYGEMTEFRADIYQGSEPSSYHPYGVVEEDTITLYMDRDLGFDETTLIWFGENKHIVTSVSDNLNGVVVRAKVLK